jgi:hypothetical protein
MASSSVLLLRIWERPRSGPDQVLGPYPLKNLLEKNTAKDFNIIFTDPISNTHKHVPQNCFTLHPPIRAGLYPCL